MNIKKKIKPVEHSCFDKAISRHCSPINFVVNLLAGLVAYCLIASKLQLPVAETHPSGLIK